MSDHKDMGQIRGKDREVRRWGAVCNLDQRAAMLLHPHTDRTTRRSNFKVKQTNQTLTYSSLFAVRSGAHREYCLRNSKEKSVITLTAAGQTVWCG